ncbi:flagellar assembly protein FliW [Clostridium aminobutyricum]|uniref:Flagellar assembly factor FliW n=1 Tax=Clostridium aminobutyricum TaxID=33953 RepID=A0A939IHG9_CLOAM|nr:flagellar assembly protein FliW [Clostridium aminobutyricum]MBN7773742.1 flagellar assembly protein FliW [Clostridium aminobutyricum]
MNTKYFGDITIHEDEIITFPTGVFGFEDNTQYVLLSFKDDTEESSEDFLMCLQSVEDSDLALIVMNPYYIQPNYDPYQVSDKIFAEISLGEETKHTVTCVAVIREDFKQSTINLKCPIFINLENNLAKQIILEDTNYSMRHPIAEKEV